jgi:hypothetical protein
MFGLILFIYVLDNCPVKPVYYMYPGSSLDGSKIAGKRNSSQPIS